MVFGKGGFCPGGFCPGGFCRGLFVQEPGLTPLRNVGLLDI